MIRSLTLSALFLLALLLIACSAAPETGGDAVAESVEPPPAEETPLPTPLLEATVVRAEQTPEAKPTPLPESSLTLSPDGRWLAIVTVGEGDENVLHVTFTVRNQETGTEWVVVDEDRARGLGFPSPLVLHWLPDENALLFTEAALPDGGAPSLYHTGLMRLSLDDGTVTELAPVEGYLAPSPDGARVAYRPGGPMVGTIPEGWLLVERDLATGEDRQIPITLEEGVRIVNFVWSPDGTSLLLVTGAGQFGEERDVWLVDVASGEQQLLIEAGEVFFALDWTEPGTALVRDNEGNERRLDVATGELSAP